MVASIPTDSGWLRAFRVAVLARAIERPGRSFPADEPSGIREPWIDLTLKHGARRSPRSAGPSL